MDNRFARLEANLKEPEIIKGEAIVLGQDFDKIINQLKIEKQN